VRPKKIPLGGKKDEKSSSKEKESHEKEVNKTLKLGAKTEIKQGRILRPLFFARISARIAG
jgi:hypothetical protein